MRNRFTRLRAWARRYPWWVGLGGAVIVYALCSLYYFSGIIVNCSDALLSGPGDQTAGLIWLNSIDPNHVFWGFTHITNYPFGEQLTSPVHASGALEYTLYFVLAKLAGSVCGFNLLNLLGFIGSALVMYGFIYWLTRRPWIALVAGYAVSFTPYLQIKTSVHPSYVYQGLLIGIVWLFLSFWRTPRLWPALALGGLTAASFYLDPYFILLAGILLVGLVGAGIVYDAVGPERWRGARRKALYMLAGLGTLLVLLLPLVYVRVHFNTQINKFVTSSRNEIKFDAQLYGARPQEYLKPNEMQPVLKALIPGYASRRDHHISNPAEYSIGLSLSLIAVVMAGAALWYARRRRGIHDQLETAVPPALLVSAAATAGALAFAFSLAPVIHGLHMPSWYLTNYITMWRVFARLYIIVNLALVVLAAVALAYLSTRLQTRRWVKGVALAVLALMVAFEYQIFPVPRPVWSYSANVPQIYYRLAQRTDIKVIAEYSLDEQPVTYRPTFYLTYQRIHHKQLINSDLPDSPQGPIRGSLRDLEDPQSLPALRALGADAIMVHNVSGVIRTPGLELIDYQATQNPGTGLPDPADMYPMALYRILSGPVGTTVVAPETGFGFAQFTSQISYDYDGGSGATLGLIDLPGGTEVRQGQACFTIRSTQSSLTAKITQGDQELWRGHLTTTPQSVSIGLTTGQPATITTSSKAKVSFLLDDLGCQL